MSFYCAAPWRSLSIGVDGDIRVCCSGQQGAFGKLEKYQIKEIISSTALKEIKTSLKNGQPHPTYCTNCVTSERYGFSERQWHNQINADFDCATADIDEYIPTLIDARWNRTCNFSCVYCNENLSSKWAAIKNEKFTEPPTKAYYEDVCDFLKEHSAHIREVAMVGGEPLLLPENSKLLDIVPDKTRITIITNLGVKLDTNPVFLKLTQRSRVGWSMSADNVGGQFEYVRAGGNWDLFSNNVDRVKQLMKSKSQWGGFHAVYNIFNCTRLTEFKQWAHSKNLTIRWNNLSDKNNGQDPSLHGDQLRSLAVQEIQRMFDECESYITDQERDFFEKVKSRLQLAPDNSLQYQKSFCDFIKRNETLYHANHQGQFVTLWPELKYLIETQQ